MGIEKQIYAEPDLVDALKSNNKEAFEYLYDKYSQALYGVIFKVLDDEEKASDVLQEVFVKIWKNIKNYEPARGRLFTWMINIARNGAIDKYRQEKAKYASISISNLPAEKYTKITPPATNEMELKNVVEMLPSDKRVLLEMVYLHGYTQQETAQILNIPLGTVKSRIRTIMQNLKNYFGV